MSEVHVKNCPSGAPVWLFMGYYTSLVVDWRAESEQYVGFAWQDAEKSPPTSCRGAAGGPERS